MVGELQHPDDCKNFIYDNMYYIIYYTYHYSCLKLGKDLNIVTRRSAKDWQTAPTTRTTDGIWFWPQFIMDWKINEDTPTSAAQLRSKASENANDILRYVLVYDILNNILL